MFLPHVLLLGWIDYCDDVGLLVKFYQASFFHRVLELVGIGQLVI